MEKKTEGEFENMKKKNLKLQREETRQISCP
jgi:hypothetical protein